MTIGDAARLIYRWIWFLKYPCMREAVRIGVWPIAGRLLRFFEREFGDSVVDS